MFAIPSTISKQVIALEPVQPRYRILIADDKPDNRKLLVALLSKFSSPHSGFDVQEAANGQEAIEIWENWSPHLICMDMRMPVLDGYQATRRINATDKGQATPIIAVTASSFEEERAVVLNAGCDNFLRKPFQEVTLFELLNKHLGVRFVYEESSQVAGSKEQVIEQKVLTPETLATLPAEWLAALKQATEEVDIERLFSVIEQIRERDVALADALACLMEEFAYDEILTLIQ